MKKLPILLAVAMVISTPSMAEPPSTTQAGTTNKLFFGKNKGQEVLTQEDVQSQDLRATVEELKKMNELLTKQNELLQQLVDNEQKGVIALLKGFDALLTKHNGGEEEKPAQ